MASHSRAQVDQGKGHVCAGSVPGASGNFDIILWWGLAWASGTNALRGLFSNHFTSRPSRPPPHRTSYQTRMTESDGPEGAVETTDGSSGGFERSLPESCVQSMLVNATTFAFKMMENTGRGLLHVAMTLSANCHLCGNPSTWRSIADKLTNLHEQMPACAEVLRAGMVFSLADQLERGVCSLLRHGIIHILEPSTCRPYLARSGLNCHEKGKALHSQTRR